MRTKLGKAVLRDNTKRMTALNEELIYLSEVLTGLSPALSKEPRYNSYGDPSEFQRFLDKVRDNRREHEKLQEEINLLVNVERWIEFKK